MANTNPDGTVLERVGGAAGDRVSSALSALAHETRLAVLLALWDAFETFPDGEWDPTGGGGLTLQELQDRTAVGDGSELETHLDRLAGHFIDQSDDRYHLLEEGKSFIRTIIANVGLEEPGFQQTELDLNCWLCGAPSAVTYQNGRMYHVCTECEGGLSLGDEHPSGVLSAWPTTPAARHGRTPAAVFEATFTDLWHDFHALTGSICPECAGKVDVSADLCDDHQPGEEEPCPECGRAAPAVARFECTVCKNINQSDFDTFAHFHPVVVGLAWKHGVDLGYGTWDTSTLDWLQHLWDDVEEEVVSSEPPRIRVTFDYEQDEVQILFDDQLNVVDVVYDY